MNAFIAAYIAILFFVFSPGTVMKSPFKFSKMVVLLIHALIFSVVLMTTIDYVNGMFYELTAPEK